jgi:hypothetical protein
MVVNSGLHSRHLAIGKKRDAKQTAIIASFAGCAGLDSFPGAKWIQIWHCDQRDCIPQMKCNYLSMSRKFPDLFAH